MVSRLTFVIMQYCKFANVINENEFPLLSIKTIAVVVVVELLRKFALDTTLALQLIFWLITGLFSHIFRNFVYYDVVCS